MPSTDLFPELNWMVPVRERREPGTLRQESQSGRALQRIIRPDRRTWTLERALAPASDVETLRAFHARLRDRYFVYQHLAYSDSGGSAVARKFPVVFLEEPEMEAAGRGRWNPRVQLIEAPGETLETADYPTFTQGHETFFLEEDDAVLAKALAGTWTSQSHGSAHGGTYKNNGGTITSDAFQFTYAGYGFRLYALKGSNHGIMQVLLDDTSLGNVDLYNASTVGAVVLTKENVPLGLHRVKLKPTNTKNASSSAFEVNADAVEVMP